ncbi:MAG TPA: ABC transporter permease subunit/CPBP intramembrane protease [Bryobacteraceae bacterium]|nr:ABC transporter permease subunit/CPBP intramembrane protease [Bryobacteraceae bacterium]
MRPRILWTIFRKEIRESLRDRRTITAMVVLPVLLYPMMILGISWLQNSEEEKTAAHASPVAVWGDATPQLLEALRAGHIEVRPSVAMPAQLAAQLQSGRVPPVRPKPEDPDESPQKPKKPEPDTPVTLAARPVLLNRSVDAVLVLWPDFAAQLSEGGLGHAAVLYDSARPASDKAHERVDAALTKFREQLLAAREREDGLRAGFAQAVEVGDANVAPPSRRAGFGLGMMLPFLLITMCLTPIFYAAIDSTAGEKERNTMQTLLCAPLRPLEIIGGKFLAVAAIGLVSAGVNITSMSLTMARISAGAFAGSVALHQYVLAFLLLIPIVLLTAGVFLAVSVFARDFKEGQNYLMPALMCMMLPCGVAIVPGIELNAVMSFAPVANIALLIKAVMMGEAAPDLSFLVIASSLLYTALAVAAAARVFSREAVLVGGSDTLRGFLGIDKPGAVRPGGAAAVLIFCVALVTAFYGSLLLQPYGALMQIAIVEVAFLLAPALLAVKMGHFSARETLLLRMPGWRGIAAAVLVGVSAGVVGAGVGMRLVRPPADFARALEKSLLMDNPHMPLAVLWLCIAILPAVCEELLFRGFILSGFRDLGKWAIPATALLFGLAHASIYRILPTFIVGLFITMLAWQTRSIVPSIIAHALNDGLIATLVHVRPSWLDMNSMREVPWTWIAAAVVVLALGFALISRRASLEAPHGHSLASAGAR